MAKDPEQLKLDIAADKLRGRKGKPGVGGCAELVMAAANKGNISKEQAIELIQSIKDKAVQRAKTKSMNYDKAVQEITGELSGQSKFMEAIKRRNLLLSYLRTKEGIRAAFKLRVPGESKKSAGKKTIKERIQNLLNTAYNAGNNLGHRYISKLEARMRAADVWDELRSGAHDKDMWIELFEKGKEGVTTRPTNNKKAQAMADIWYDLKSKEVNPMSNRAGTYIENSPEWVIKQTTDSHVVRSLANMKGARVITVDGRLKIKSTGRIKRAPGQKIEAGQKLFWEIFEEAGIVVNWEKVLDGTPMNTYKKNYHNNHHNNAYGPAADSIGPETFKTHGSLANKMSESRSLWLADGESAWKRNQLFGVHKTLYEDMISDLESSGRSIGMLQTLGPNPKNNLQVMRNTLIDMVSGRKDPGTLFKDPAEAAEIRDIIAGLDSDVAIKGIRNKVIDNDYAVLSGEANISKHPTFSRITDNIKAMQTLAKLGAAVVSSLSDKAFLNNAMARQGFEAMDRLQAQLLVHAPKGAGRKAYLEELGYTADALSHNVAGRWLTDFSPWRLLKKASDYQFKISGMNMWVRIHEQVAAEMLGFKMGQEAGKAFSQLSDIRKRNFAEWDITEAEWNAVRRNPSDGYDGKKVLTMESARNMSDSQVDELLLAQGKKVTKHNRTRAKEDIERKLGAYFESFVTEAVPKPGLRERSITSQGLQRGEPLRELSELFWLFKSFPLSVMRKTVKQWRMSDEGVRGKLWLGSMLLQTGIAGYIAMTVKDALMGKTPRRLWDNGPNGKVWIESMLRGGGAGIWGDVLFQEYDNYMRTPLSTFSGPALGDISTALALGTQVTRSLVGLEGGPETKAYQAQRLLEQNLPFANLWYLKPFLENMFWLNVKESLSPGVLNRMEASLERRNVQEYWLPPTETGNIPITEPGKKIKTGFERAEDLIKETF